LSEKKVSIISLVLIAVFTIIYLIEAKSFPVIQGNSIGPAYFPVILSVIILSLCVLDLIITIVKKEDEQFRVPNLKYLLITIIMVGIFVVSWYATGLFYFISFFFFLVLTSIYRWGVGVFKKTLIINIVFSTGATLLVFLLFEVILNVKL